MVQLKKNQRSVWAQVVNAHGRAKPIDVYQEPVSKAHGRLEERRYDIYQASDILSKWQGEWPFVRSVIKVTRARERLKPGSQKRCEVSYYLTNEAAPKAKTMAHVIRGHWGIENKNHYVRDTAFQEDRAARRINPGIFSRIISMSYNALKDQKKKNVRGTLFENSLDFSYLISSSLVF